MAYLEESGDSLNVVISLGHLGQPITTTNKVVKNSSSLIWTKAFPSLSVQDRCLDDILQIGLAKSQGIFGILFLWICKIILGF